MNLLVTVLILSNFIVPILCTSTLDNNSFLIYNGKYRQARLTNTNYGGMTTSLTSYEGKIHSDQIWVLMPVGGKSRCFYIKNAKTNNRIGILSSNGNVIMTKGYYHEDQEWKFVASGNSPGYDYIQNCHHKSKRLSKYGREDNKISVFDGYGTDQVWKLVPRIKAGILTSTIHHIDNRQGLHDISIELSITRGFKRKTTQTITHKSSFTVGLEAAMSVAVSKANIGMDFKTEFTISLEKVKTTEIEQSWQETRTIKFTVPARKNFKVMQHEIIFDSVLPGESGTLHTAYKVFVSDTVRFQDPDGFIIKS